MPYFEVSYQHACLRTRRDAGTMQRQLVATRQSTRWFRYIKQSPWRGESSRVLCCSSYIYGLNSCGERVRRCRRSLFAFTKPTLGQERGASRNNLTTVACFGRFFNPPKKRQRLQALSTLGYSSLLLPGLARPSRRGKSTAYFHLRARWGLPTRSTSRGSTASTTRFAKILR